MRTRTRNLKRLLSLALCLCMVTGLLPVTALAAEDTPVITTESLAEATVGEAYTAQLTAKASDQNGQLDWEAEGLPNGLALSGSGETATLLGPPIEAGTFTVTVTVTETIPAAEPEEPAAQEAGPDGVTEPAGESQPTVLTASRTYTLTVAEAPANEPINEPPANAPLTDDGSTRTTYQSVSATIYTSQNEDGGFENSVSTFPVDQAGLILDLRSFNQTVSSGWSVESIAFYPADGSSEQEAVFWYDGEGDYVCTNGTKNDKLYNDDGTYNGVFQILDFTPNGNMELEPGKYQVLVYVGNGQTGDAYQELYYLSTETFIITGAMGPGEPVINTTTLPEATVGVEYSAALTANPAAGGTLSWELVSGSSLPAGLALSTDGKITGTPTAAVSSHAFTVQVTETPAEGGEALTGTKELTLTVKEAAAPTITTTSLPLAFLGVSYTAELEGVASSGGTLSWSITSNNKPDWLNLNANTGALSGDVPGDAAMQSVDLTFQVTETLGGGVTRTADTTLTLTVTQKLEITNTTTSFNPTRGEEFSLTLMANLENVTWSRKSGSLPSGLQFNSSNGTISGTVSAYARDGEYTYTVTARSPDGQTAEKTLTFTVGSLFYFTLPNGLDGDAINRSASLRATLDGNQVTLWSGKLTGQGQTLTVNSAYAGEQVTDVKLTTYLNRGDVTLATAGSVTLTDGQTVALTAETDPIITLPAFTYGGLDNYVSAWFVDSSGWRYNSGDLADSSETFTLKASTNAYQYRSDGKTDYDLNGTPSFSGNTGVSGTTYTPSNGDGDAIAVTYLRLTKKTVTFTLQLMEGGTTGTEVALNRASLSITQYVNGQSVRTTAQIQNNTTATAQLYTGMEANLSLLSAGGCYLKETTINQVVNEHTLTYYTSEHTQATLLITPKLANDSEVLLTYAKNLPGSKLSPTITVGSDNWKINSVQAAQCAGKSTTSRIWSYYKANSIATLAKGAEYSLSWPEYQGLLEGSLTGQKWPAGQLNAAAEVPINLKGGVLLSLTNSDNIYAALQDWWYQEDTDGNGTWITSGRTTTLSGSSNYSFYCPGDNGKYDFLLLPREAQPIGMTWEEAAAYFQSMPALKEVNVQDNKVTTGAFTVSEVETANARYLTLPNSTLSGPDQFTSTEELLSFTGGIQLDDGVDGKLETLRIQASGTDIGGRVAFQISSLQINGKSYPYAGIHLRGDPLPKDTLMNEQFTTYYQIDFEEPISLPCTFTLYGNAMSNNSDVKLSLTVKLKDVTGVSTATSDQWQPLGMVTAQAPALSVSIPAVVGTETATAYLTIPGPSSYRVDIYDGDTLVVSGARAGEVEIPLEKTSSSRTTSHDLSFRWQDGKVPEDASSKPYEVTVLHTNGLPTLLRQQLQVQIKTNWHTFERDRIYSFSSSNPNPFRAVCEIAHYKKIKGSVTFLFHLLDGTTVTQTGAGAAPTDSNGDIWTITSKSFRSSSPVIGVSVIFEVDWDKVNDFLEYNAPKLPNDSPSRDITDEVFTETVVIPSREHNIQFSQLPTEFPETSTEDMPSRQDLWKKIQELQGKIEEIYEENDGQAGFYIIDIGNDQFLPALDMINGLDTGYIPQGDTGTTTMTRELSSTELTTELGSGEWSRYAFTEPGDPGSGETTGMEVYTQSVTTDSGVQASITIATDGNTTVEFAMAQGTGTGTNPYTLPDSGTYPSGGTSSGGVGGFSFTTFESDGMSVFSNVCGDVTTGSNTIKDITAAVTGAEATGLFKPLEQGLGAYSFTKDMMDGVSNEITLMDLLNAPNKWLSSPCAQKLTPQFRTNMQNQINNFIKDVRDAEGWNMAVTGANYVLGAGGLVGMFSNPFTATVSVVGGVGSWLAGKLTSQKIDNVQRQAAVLKDTIDLQITATAIRNNDRECMPKYNGADPANRGAGSGYGTGSGRGGSTAPYRVCIDPSGIVYEAVLSNPVKDATVTLYTDGTGFVPEYSTDDNGIPIMVNNGAPATPTNGYSGSGTLTTPVDSTIPAENVLTTGADGRFQWMVEQGLWYVTAYKDGYQPGDSGNDVAAVVSDSNGRRWLPVSPEQTNVNIPLVSYEPPTVTVEARSDGVYLTFSKYMDEDTLKAENFTLTDSDGQEISITDVELLNSEKAPSNIDYDGDAPWYTSQVKLAVNEVLSGDVTVTIAETVVSYAGVPRRDRTASGTVQEGTLTVEAPEVDGKTGQVEYGDTVTLTIPDGAAVYYTTDGSKPSYDDNGQPTGTTIRYYEGQPIVITRTMTIRAVAVKYGERSEVVSEKFTVSGTGGGIPEVPDDPDDPDDEPDTPATPGGATDSGSSGYAVSVPASSSIRGGSITVSPRSAEKGDTVTITVKPDDGYELDTLSVTDGKGIEVELTGRSGGRYTFIMPASNVKIRVSFRETAAQVVNPFTDVSTGAYYYDAVLWAVANGVTNGTSATTFSPDVTVTRAQMVTFLWRSHGAPRATGSNPFTDVSADAYYYDAVLWAVANGVTNGTTATTFSPNAPVTRAQAVTFQWRASGSPAVSGGSFSDVAADAYYSGAVAWAVANGITNGTTATTFSPDTPVSRAQAVTFLWRELA